MRYELGRCRLGEILRERKLTQAEIARKTGYSPQEVSDWVNNRKGREKMSYTTAISVAKAIPGVHAEDLYELIPINPSEPRQRQLKG